MGRTATGRMTREEQKTRTRAALIEACRRLIPTGQPMTMPAVAEEAGVSDATAYRHFPDLVALINEALTELWPSADDVMRPLEGSTDTLARLDLVCDFFFRRVLAYQGSVRAVIAATVTHPERVRSRPGFRFALIDEVLAPLAAGPAPVSPSRLTILKHDLSAVISAEALLSLTDLCLLTPEEAIGSLNRTARTITAVALAEPRGTTPQPPASPPG